MRSQYINILFLCIIALVLQSCATSALDQDKQIPILPTNFQASSSSVSVDENWLASFSDASETTLFAELVNEAMKNNQTIISESYQVSVIAQQLLISESDFWPSLEASFSAGRSKNISNSDGTSSANNAFSLGADLSYELDLWGALSDAERQAKLSYLSALSSFEEAKLTLMGDVLIAYADASRAKQRVLLAEQQVKNSSDSLDIIERGYQAGLIESLDVYLARNELNSDISSLAENREALVRTTRILERLLGRYPSAELDITLAIQLPESQLGLGIPSDVVTRNPGIKADWLALMAQDASLAIAHKARFPSLNISANIGPSSDKLSDLLSNASAWSLLGNISAPLFNAGRLEANEEIERLTLQSLEASYLNSVLNTLRDVENAVSQEQTLMARFEATRTAKESAEIARQLSFEQYQAGLVSYTTVLDAQERLITAQNQLIDITTDMITNRIELHVSLGAGANFAGTTNEIERYNEIF